MTETPRVMIAKLNNDNYESWRYKVELLLIKEGLWDVVSKAAPAQPEAAPNQGRTGKSNNRTPGGGQSAHTYS